MTDGGPQRKSASRYIATGCTALVVLAAAVAAAVGFAFYKISRGMDEIADIGSAWIGRQPETAAHFGEIQRVDRLPARRALDVKQGSGWFDFQVQGSRASGRARVSVVRHEGEWRAVGARLTVGDRETTLGTPP